MEIVLGLTDDLRRAAHYREGRRVSDEEVLRLLRRDVAEVVDQWTRLGRWIGRLDARGL